MKRQIIIEVERVRVVYNRKNKGLKWCSFCRTEVAILTLEEAVEIAGIEMEIVLDFLARGKLHLYQTPDDEDKPQICLSSLLNAAAGNHLF
jgi:hypothetical protein